jgi:hypothetical protein
MSDLFPKLPTNYGGQAPPKTTELSEMLAAFLALSQFEVRDRYYKNQVVYLDGYRFHNCCFENCTLVSESGDFLLKGCRLIVCGAHFGPKAVKLVRLFNLMAKPPFDNIWLPTVAPDGSVTIG